MLLLNTGARGNAAPAQCVFVWGDGTCNNLHTVFFGALLRRSDVLSRRARGGSELPHAWGYRLPHKAAPPERAEAHMDAGVVVAQGARAHAWGCCLAAWPLGAVPGGNLTAPPVHAR